MLAFKIERAFADSFSESDRFDMSPLAEVSERATESPSPSPSGSSGPSGCLPLADELAARLGSCPRAVRYAARASSHRLARKCSFPSCLRSSASWMERLCKEDSGLQQVGHSTNSGFHTLTLVSSLDPETATSGITCARTVKWKAFDLAQTEGSVQYSAVSESVQVLCVRQSCNTVRWEIWIGGFPLLEILIAPALESSKSGISRLKFKIGPEISIPTVVSPSSHSAD